MQKSKIEWTDYSINPIKGLCKNECWYCYAKRIYKRFKWDTNISFSIEVFDEVEKLKKPSRIFVGSTHDIFGKWICYSWIANIIKYCSDFSQHTFIFLTKNPSRYKQCVFPQNCWLGTSIESNDKLGRLYDLCLATKGKNKIFVSFEPLLDELIDLPYYVPELAKLDWAIIGGLTPKPVHKVIWGLELIATLHELNIPIFVKDNLKSLTWGFKKEFPN